MGSHTPSPSPRFTAYIRPPKLQPTNDAKPRSFAMEGAYLKFCLFGNEKRRRPMAFPQKKKTGLACKEANPVVCVVVIASGSCSKIRVPLLGPPKSCGRQNYKQRRITGDPDLGQTRANPEDSAFRASKGA